MNRAVRNARKSQRHLRFGSIGSVANIKQPDATLIELVLYRENQTRPYPLFRNGAWIQQNLRFAEDEDVKIAYRVLGNGGSYIFGSYSAGGRNLLLFVRPVRAGEGMFEFRVPIDKLRGFHIAMSKTIPRNYDTAYLSDEEKQYIRQFPMALSNNAPTTFSPTLGSLGFTPIPDVRHKASGKTETGRDFWDGKLSKHSYKKHGYTGKAGTTSGGNTATHPIGPSWASYPTARHAFRAAFYEYQENTDGTYGWNAVEKVNFTVGAGIPMAFVGQFAKHDNDKVFPEWHWETDSVPKEKVFLIQSWAASKYQGKKYEKKAKSVYTRGSVIDVKIDPWPELKYKLSKTPDIPAKDSEAGKSGETNGNYDNKDLRRLAVKVEWWDSKAKTWKLGRHPPHSLDLNSKGKFVAYFRFPRQLSAKDPDLKHWDGFALGPNSKNQGTAHCYPNTDGSYNIIGRSYVPNEEGKLSAPVITVEKTGETIRGRPDYDNVIGTMIRGKTNSLFLTQNPISVTDKEKEVYFKNPNFSNIFWKEGDFKPGSKMVVIGQALTSWQVGGYIGISTNRDETAGDIHQSVYWIKRGTVKAGSKNHDLLKIINVITTDDLLDNVDLVYSGVQVERNVKNAWKEVFGSDLTAQWFRDINAGLKDKDGNTLPGLAGANPKNPLHYTINDSGQEFSYPYSIAVVEIPSNWIGPIVDFVEEGGESKLSEISIKETTPVYIVGRNSLRYDVEQKLNLTAEIKEQLAALNAGKSATETIITAGQIPDKMIEESNEVFHAKHQAPQEAAAEAAASAPASGLFEGSLFDMFKLKPFKTDSKIRATTLLPVGSKEPLQGLGGMNRNNHTLTDVSGKYASDRQTSLGAVLTGDPSEQSKLDEFYLMNGMTSADMSGPTLDWLGAGPRRPQHQQTRTVAPQFGSAYNNSNLARKKGRVMTEPFRKGQR